MKHPAAVLLVLLVLFPLFADDRSVSVVLADADAGTEIGTVVSDAVEDAVRQSLLPRIAPAGFPEEGLEVMVAPITHDGFLSLSTELTFVLGARRLHQTLAGTGKDASSLSRSLYKTLLLQLRYDGLALSDMPEGPSVSYDHGSGYAAMLSGSAATWDIGDAVSVVDATGTVQGALVLDDRVGEERTVGLFAVEAGSNILPGMSLVPRKGKQVSLFGSVFGSVDAPAWGIGATYRQGLGLPPFWFSLAASVRSDPSDSLSAHLLAGVVVDLPFSLFFGTGSPVWRNSGLEAFCRAGFGFSASRTTLLLGSEAGVSLRYWTGVHTLVRLSVSHDHWVVLDTIAPFDSGLSVSLAMAYTW